MMENNGQSMAEIMKDLYRKSYREAAKVIVQVDVTSPIMSL